MFTFLLDVLDILTLWSTFLPSPSLPMLVNIKEEEPATPLAAMSSIRREIN